MEDGVRIWWSKGDNGEAYFHIVGGLVLKEGKLLDELTDESGIAEQRRKRLCEMYYKPLLYQWLSLRHNVDVDDQLYPSMEFSEDNAKQAAELTHRRPYRGYVGVFIRVRPPSR